MIVIRWIVGSGILSRNDMQQAGIVDNTYYARFNYRGTITIIRNVDGAITICNIARAGRGAGADHRGGLPAWACFGGRLSRPCTHQGGRRKKGVARRRKVPLYLPAFSDLFLAFSCVYLFGDSWFSDFGFSYDSVMMIGERRYDSVMMAYIPENIIYKYI